MDLVKYPSLLILVIANLIPLYGVYNLGWSVPELLLLYWGESAIVGFFTLLKMLLSKGTIVALLPVLLPRLQTTADGADAAKLAGAADMMARASIMVFFTIHYGAFMLGHLVFIIALFIQDFSSGLLSVVLLGSASLFASHGVSFVMNYVGKKEFLKADARNLMAAPYNRIVLMHVAIIFGAFISAPAAVLIAGKTLADSYSHLKEREHFST